MCFVNVHRSGSEAGRTESLSVFGVRAQAVMSGRDMSSSQQYDGSEELDRLIQSTVLIGDFAAAVQLALSANRLDDALLLAHIGGAELFQRTCEEFFARRTEQGSAKPYHKVCDCMCCVSSLPCFFAFSVDTTSISI